jgi:hypothetical protein
MPRSSADGDPFQIVNEIPPAQGFCHLWRDDQDRKMRQSGLERAVAARDD